MEIEQERLKRLDEVKDAFRMFYQSPKEYSLEVIIDAIKKIEKGEVLRLLDESIKHLEDIDNWDKIYLEEEMRRLCELINTKTKILFMLLRVAVTGSRISPPLFDVFEIIGKEETLKRLRRCRMDIETQ
ncbi:hypothetical protein PL321_02570 [Caloramator sp. mosi_1]|uniref:hypothetical protein n=1 Tax=Caloramator sp. mosi_1 TaxID=3023090 RepID=UPI0023610520|nr:hypothetical protein [Caloramator sp. mosi_1]WDC84611.1 hypothetical protein PL321_02570 [Caloramator sp. mosi_1]